MKWPLVSTRTEIGWCTTLKRLGPPNGTEEVVWALPAAAEPGPATPACGTPHRGEGRALVGFGAGFKRLQRGCRPAPTNSLPHIGTLAASVPLLPPALLPSLTARGIASRSGRSDKNGPTPPEVAPWA